MANRHGLVAGATCSAAKTVSLRVMAEASPAAASRCVLADVKGDLSGLAQPGGGQPQGGRAA